MEIRPVEGEGCEPGGYVVEVLGQVEFRQLRHEACEAAMAILEREIDRLRQIVEHLTANGCPDAGAPERQEGKTTTVIRS
jgi:anti-sigma factor RsiW